MSKKTLQYLGSGILLLAFHFTASAQENPLQIMYHPAKPAVISINKNIEYNVITKLRFDLYQPTVMAADAPLVIIMNGFGSPEQKDAEYQVQWARLIAEDGMNAITFESHTEDVEGDFDALTNFLHNTADKYKVNPKRLIVFSFSGNVQKGLPMITDPQRNFIRAGVVYYGYGPVKSFKYDMPVFLVRSGLDNPRLNRNIDSITFRALSNNAPWTIINHQSGKHPFEFSEPIASSITVIKQTLEFMHSVTSDVYIKSLQQKADEIQAGTALYTSNWKEAVRLYSKIIDVDKNSDNYLKLGNAYFGAELYENALDAYQKCLDMGDKRFRDISIPASLAAARLKNVNETLKWLAVLAKSPGGKQYILTENQFNFVSNDERYISLTK